MKAVISRQGCVYIRSFLMRPGERVQQPLIDMTVSIRRSLQQSGLQATKGKTNTTTQKRALYYFMLVLSLPEADLGKRKHLVPV